jgi:glycosyltransferase involved in cell wall biosynthesis
MEDDAQPRVIVVMPAYNAAQTLVRTYSDIPAGVVHHVILVDDVSRDDTVAIAKLLDIQVVVHRQNTGYGGNQKTCYDTALAQGAQVVVMLHPDYQYDATRIPDLIAPILAGEADMMLGSRFLGDPLAGGMPRWKYVANRFLTGTQNRVYGLRLSDYHANSDDFVFDQELVGQVVRAGFRIGEIPVPTRYFAEASSVNFRRSVVYGLATLGSLASHLRRSGALPASGASRPSGTAAE